MFKMCLNGLFSTIFEENSKLINTFYAILIKFTTNLMTNLLKIKSCVPNFLKQISKSASKISASAFLSLTILSAIILAFFFSIKIAKFLVNCGDIESNPGFTFMQWNCNSLPAHDYTRVSLIEAYNTLHNFDLIALSETALRPDHQNKPLEIKGYSIIRNDLPTGDTHGGVMIYHKDDLAVKHRPDLQIIPNVIAIEISLKRKKVFFIYTYRKHGQTDLQRHDFEDKIDEIIKKTKDENPHCVLLAGDFNAHNSLWYEDDRTDPLGTSLQKIFADNGLTQLTNQPTFLTNNSRTCIDLTITDQPNLVLKNEVHPSIHTN